MYTFIKSGIALVYSECLKMNTPNTYKAIALSLAISLFISCQKNQPPTCQILKPDNGSEFSRGEVIPIAVDTDDPDGIVAEVRLYVNGSGLTGLSFPYNYDLITDEYTPGQYTLKVTAWDNEGMEASDEVVVTISVAQSQVTTYYVKAFSVNAAGESVGNEISFTTKGGLAVVTGPVVSMKYKSVVVEGEVTDDGGITVTETGFYWGDAPGPES